MKTAKVLLFALTALTSQAVSIDPSYVAPKLSPKHAEAAKVLGAKMAIAPPPESNTVTFSATWSPSPSASGYVLGIGTTSGVYRTNVLTVETNAMVTVEWPGDAMRFFFAVKSTNSSGESAWSREVVVPPWPPDRAWLSWKTGPVDQSVNLKVWSVFTNSGSPVLILFNNPRKFFRGDSLKMAPFNPKN